MTFSLPRDTRPAYHAPNPNPFPLSVYGVGKGAGDWGAVYAQGRAATVSTMIGMARVMSAGVMSR